MTSSRVPSRPTRKGLPNALGRPTDSPHGRTPPRPRKLSTWIMPVLLSSMNTPQVFLRVPTHPSDPWSRSLAARTRPGTPKNCHPPGIFWGGRVGSLDEGAERSASRAEREGEISGDPSNDATHERATSDPSACPSADHLPTPTAKGRAARLHQGGSEPTVPSGAGCGKSCKGSAPRGGFGGLQATDGRGSEGGGRGWGGEPAVNRRRARRRLVEGACARRARSSTAAGSA